MNYDYFMSMVRHHQTKKIRAFEGPQQSNPHHVPTAFGLLVSEIITILDENFHQLCESDKILSIFGIQLASAMLTSHQPITSKRFINGLQPDYHFCCTLNFFKINPEDTLNEVSVWASSDAVFVDFTTGKVMDSDHYISILNNQPAEGVVYGTISKDALDIAWKIVTIKQAKENNHNFAFSNYLKEDTISEVA